jgi:hypothetical protein
LEKALWAKQQRREQQEDILDRPLKKVTCYLNLERQAGFLQVIWRPMFIAEQK